MGKLSREDVVKACERIVGSCILAGSKPSTAFLLAHDFAVAVEEGIDIEVLVKAPTEPAPAMGHSMPAMSPDVNKLREKLGASPRGNAKLSPATKAKVVASLRVLTGDKLDAFAQEFFEDADRVTVMGDEGIRGENDSEFRERLLERIS